MPADAPGALRVDIDLGSSVPPYEQIRAQVLAHVAAGRLVVGDRLPTIRALATDLGLAPGTVARAYRELEASGAVATRRRAGTVVADGASSADVVARQAARDLVRTTRGVGLTDDAILAAVRDALHDEHDARSPNGRRTPDVS